MNTALNASRRMVLLSTTRVSFKVNNFMVWCIFATWRHVKVHGDKFLDAS